LASLTV